MSKLKVVGGIPLRGEIAVHGSKNAALPILAATVLFPEPVELTNCPELADVRHMLALLEELGCRIRQQGDRVEVDPRGITCTELRTDITRRLRSSLFLLGPLLSRFHEAAAVYPGGCDIGRRPIDLHLQGLRLLGAEIEEREGRIYCRTAGLKGTDIQLDYPSVGATENLIMAACIAQGVTRIINGACEPEIVTLCEFLNRGGFSVTGAGTPQITIRGRGEGRSIRYEIPADRIVAGTYLAAGAITGGEIFVRNAPVKELTAPLNKLREAGCLIREERMGVYLKGPKRPRELKKIETRPYPGFPTDLQSQFFALCTVARGTSLIVENVFENRFVHGEELQKMGALCHIRGDMAVIRGVKSLHGADLTAHDLRGGAALVLAGLRAEGMTRIEGAQRIDRGYVRLEEALSALGGRVTREPPEANV